MNEPNISFCPFCGGSASVWSKKGKYGPMVYVKCDVCDAQTRIKSAKPIEDEEAFWRQIAVEEAVALWNRRV